MRYLLLLGVFWTCGQTAAPTPVQEVLPSTDTLIAQLQTVADLPPPPPDYDTTAWTELSAADTFALDVRYATTNNFMQLQVYPCGRCFLRPAVASALQRAGRTLRAQRYGLVLYDCYRPRPAQQKLWDVTPDPRYVTPPAKGSMHNRGAAVDLALTDLLTGDTLDMGTPYDYFGREAWPAYTDLPKEILNRRAALRAALLAEGFKGIRTEWWHFAYPGAGAALSDWEWPCK